MQNCVSVVMQPLGLLFPLDLPIDTFTLLLAVHYDGPGERLPGTTPGGYGWGVRTEGLTSHLAAEPGQDEGGDGGQPTNTVAT
jgi:hypothetical protein